jgi:hypothetical protein
MGRNSDEILACAQQLELLLRGSPSRERIENACALIDSLQPDLTTTELADVAARFRGVAREVGRKTKRGPIPPDRLYNLAVRFKLAAEAAHRRGKRTP